MENQFFVIELNNWTILIVVIFLFLFIIFALFSFSSEEESEMWFPKHLLPQRSENSDYSDDVLIQCYDTQKHIIGCYDFKEDVWRCINYQDIPQNFKWRYLKIEIE